MPKSSCGYVKNEEQYKTLAWTHVLYIPSSFISCFRSAQYGHYMQHGQHQANMREFIPNVPQHVVAYDVDCSCY